jgi:hypothetical protein
MLDDLESVLVDVSRGPDRMEGKALASLRKRIEGSDLLFKVRAVTDDIHRRQRNLAGAN